MALLTQAPRGTQDVLPAQSHRWQYVERSLLSTAELFGFRELRFPTFEHTELFQRSVGDTTDVVQKEMYTFTDKGGRSLTLRPEGTSSTVRALLEHGLLGGTLPLKVSYLPSCFRYEKPQAGRLREFHQFGVETFGAAGPDADAETIAVGIEILRAVGVEELALEINSIGCPKCRPGYHRALKSYFEARREDLCPTCQERMEKNPLRILDCKSPICSAIAKDAPKGLDHLCEECSDHFEGLKTRLGLLGLSYTINPRIVRGLDYYTKTVFEVIATNIGSQGTVIGGGRYDGLVEEQGGSHVPAVGFAMGIERLLMVMEAVGAQAPEAERCDVYLAGMGEAGGLKAFELANLLRREGYFTESDLMGRSLKAQMKYADKIGAKYTIVLGDDEIARSKAKLKNMATGETVDVTLGETLGDELAQVMMNTAYTQE